jgi:hypothetical protein
MTLLGIVAATIGAIVPVVVIVRAVRAKTQDRWPEGVLVGIYLGALGAISVIALIAYFG